MASEGLSKDEAWPQQVGAFDRALTVVEDAFGAIAALFILALMLLGAAQVLIRVIWNLPIPGYIDFVELLMAVVAFAAIGYAERLRAHIRMDFLPGVLTGRTQVLLEMALTVLALMAISVLVYSTWFSFVRTWNLGDSTMDIQAPLWPSKLLLFVSLALLWLRLVLSVIGYGRSLASGSAND